MLESKQTYNPYHLSSYKMIDDTEGDLSPGSKGDGGPFGDIPLHEINYISKQIGFGHLQGDKNVGGEDSKKIF